MVERDTVLSPEMGTLNWLSLLEAATVYEILRRKPSDNSLIAWAFDIGERQKGSENLSWEERIFYGALYQANQEDRKGKRIGGRVGLFEGLAIQLAVYDPDVLEGARRKMVSRALLIAAADIKNPYFVIH